MTLDELIEELTDFRECEGCGELQVVMTADYGDICKTLQALPIRGISLETTRESAYSNSGRAINVREEESDDDDEDERATENVVALNMWEGN